MRRENCWVEACYRDGGLGLSPMRTRGFVGFRHSGAQAVLASISLADVHYRLVKAVFARPPPDRCSCLFRLMMKRLNQGTRSAKRQEIRLDNGCQASTDRSRALSRDFDTSFHHLL